MTALSRMMAAVQNLLHAQKVESDLEAEVRAYVDAVTEERVVPKRNSLPTSRPVERKAVVAALRRATALRSQRGAHADFARPPRLIDDSGWWPTTDVSRTQRTPTHQRKAHRLEVARSYTQHLRVHGVFARLPFDLHVLRPCLHYFSVEDSSSCSLVRQQE